jgi:hypothetical protein
MSSPCFEQSIDIPAKDRVSIYQPRSVEQIAQYSKVRSTVISEMDQCKVNIEFMYLVAALGMGHLVGREYDVLVQVQTLR